MMLALYAERRRRGRSVDEPRFTPIATDDWEIACSQLCGLGHYRMRGEYHVIDHAAWDRWQADEAARLR